MAQEKTLNLLDYRKRLTGFSAGHHLTVPTGQFWEILNRAIEAEDQLAGVTELVDVRDSKSRVT